MVQWLGLCASTAGEPCSIPGGGTKVLRASRCGQRKKKRMNSPRLFYSFLILTFCRFASGTEYPGFALWLGTWLTHDLRTFLSPLPFLGALDTSGLTPSSELLSKTSVFSKQLAPTGFQSTFFLKNKFILFIYFWLHWVFIAVRGLSLVAVSRGYSLLWCTGFSLRWLLLLRSTGSRRAGVSSCGTWASVIVARGL